MSQLTLENISVSYDGKTDVLRNLSLDVPQGALVALLGPSGCGKTTTLNVLAGFIQPKSGRFTLSGRDYTRVPVHKRGFGLVFQNYALFPHLDVYRNIAFGLRMKKVDRAQTETKVTAALEQVGLKSLAHRFPRELSGGQKQRVALARALVVQPSLLLLDEPLSNLDAKLRLRMRVEIRRIQQQLGTTTIFVTHDQEECFSISDRVAIMNGGMVEQYDTPENIYAHPATEFVARFVGFENFIPLQTHAQGGGVAEDGTHFRSSHPPPHGGAKLQGTIRPDDLRIASAESTDNVVSGNITVRTFLGRAYQYDVNTSLGHFVVRSESVYQRGTEVKLYFDPEKLILLPEDNR